MKIRAILAALILLVSGQVGAAIIDNGDWTTDTDTGLAWLDVTLSIGRSYNDVSTQFGVGGDFEGWRYATQADFRTLVSNFFEISYAGGVFTDAPFGDTDNQIVEDFINLFGDTGQFGLGPFSFVPDVGHTYGILEHFEFPGLSKLGLVYDWEGEGFDSIDMLHDSNYIENIFESANVGSFLVRVSPVPAPAALLLFGTALLALVGFSKRRKSAQSLSSLS